MSVFGLDLHIHAGNERWGQPLGAFVDAARRRGVRLAGLLDHAEFYLADKPDWIRVAIEEEQKAGIALYSGDLDGLRALYADLRALRPVGATAGLSSRAVDRTSTVGQADRGTKPALPQSDAVRLVFGLELKSVKKTPDAFLEFPDYLCLCVDGFDPKANASYGEWLAPRVRRFAQKIEPTGKAGIVNHPFRPVVGLYRERLDGGEAPLPDRFIPRGDIARVADAAAESGLFLEVNLSTLAGADASEPMRDLCLHILRAMVESKADLSLGSDSHSLPAASPSPMARWLVGEAGLSEARLARVARRLGFPPDEVFGRHP